MQYKFANETIDEYKCSNITMSNHLYIIILSMVGTLIFEGALNEALMMPRDAPLLDRLMIVVFLCSAGLMNLILMYFFTYFILHSDIYTLLYTHIYICISIHPLHLHILTQTIIRCPTGLASHYTARSCIG